MAKPFKVLTSGGGVAGSVFAYWLAKASTASRPVHVTIIEKALSVLKAGQGIDVEGGAKEIVTRMGLLDEIKQRTTIERGFKCIDNNDRPYATFDQGGLTQEIEIMRGDLCDVLMTAAKQQPNVDLHFGTQITDMDQTDDKVQVTTLDGSGNSNVVEYDAVVAADGIRSRTRDLMLDPGDTGDCLKSINMFVAFFSVPAQPDDGRFSRMQHATGGRLILIRPVSEKVTSVYLIAVGEHPILASSMGYRDPKAKRQAWADAFSDIGYGGFSRAVPEIRDTDNFYSDQVTQVKLPTWHKGRFAVVGDAAYAPSPATGQGTALAIIGAYILAGELSSKLENPVMAFQKYEETMRPYITRWQPIPLAGRAPQLFCPQSRAGIWLLQTAFWLVSISKIWRSVPNTEEHFPLPDYRFG